MFLKLSIVLAFFLAFVFVFQEASADDCFFKACVPLVTDCGFLKSCRDFCCQIDLGK